MKKIISLEDKLEFYAKKHYNVLLEGTHGVGKTTLIENTFNKLGWKYLILNASTIDPYIDFIGIPSKKEILVENEKVEVIRNILPEIFETDGIDALFLDEINRGKKEVLNGLLDLIQFKSIKNKKLKKLKVVWAAKNPYFEELDDEEQIYNVKPLDPALKDRFHAFITVPRVLNKKYLKEKYGTISTPFTTWWNSLDDKLQELISPRRLDYSIQAYIDGAELNDVINNKLPIKNLEISVNEFESNNIKNELIKNISSKSINDASLMINIENIDVVMSLIHDDKIDKKYLKSINQDILEIYLKSNKNKDILNMVENNIKYDEQFNITDGVKNIISKTNNSIITKLSSSFEKHRSKLELKDFSQTLINDPVLINNTLKTISLIFIETQFNLYKETDEYTSINVVFDRYKDLFLSDKEYKCFGESQKLLTMLYKNNGDNKELITYLKKLFNNEKSNYLISLISGFIYKKITIDYINKIKKINNVSKVENMLNRFFKNKIILDIFKQNKNLFYIAYSNNNVSEIIDNILKQIIEESDDLIQLEINATTKIDYFIDLISSIN